MLFWFFAKTQQKNDDFSTGKNCLTIKRQGVWRLRDSAVLMLSDQVRPILGLIKAKSTLFTIVWQPQEQVSHLSEYFFLPSKPIHCVLKSSDYYSVLKNAYPDDLRTVYVTYFFIFFICMQYVLPHTLTHFNQFSNQGNLIILNNSIMSLYGRNLCDIHMYTVAHSKFI